MKSTRTYYEILQVSQHAPLEVIRAAYKALSQKYHPDRNPNDPDALEMMKFLNIAYQTLSDSDKRAEYDYRINRESLTDTFKADGYGNRSMHGKSISTIKKILSNEYIEPWWDLVCIVGNFIKHVVLRVTLVAFSMGITFGGLWVVMEVYDLFAEDSVTATSAQVNANVPPRPDISDIPVPDDLFDDIPIVKAPNGEYFPDKSGYVRGYPMAGQNGLSKITIDNSRNEYAVFVKLYDKGQGESVRYVFVSAYGSFSIENISSGFYEVRYQELLSGDYFKSEPFSLEEKTLVGGTEYTDMRMTIYKVANGNMETYRLSEFEF